MKTLKELTFEIVLERLNHFDGNRTLTAESLGISQRTIRNYLSDIRKTNLKDRIPLPKGKSKDRYRCNVFPTNKERIAYRDKF